MTARIAEIANRITVVAAVMWVVVIALIITARLQLGVDHTLVGIHGLRRRTDRHHLHRSGHLRGFVGIFDDGRQVLSRR